MAQGIFWSILLIFFAVLAGLGWWEYRRIEAYRLWATQFDHAKYDIYAVLGQKGQELIWGKPTRRGPVDLQQINLAQVEAIALWIDDQPVDLDALPARGRRISLALQPIEKTTWIKIPFTEIPLAAEWTKHLQQSLEKKFSGEIAR
uniref:Uncharacterized protein n=1 Tax=Cyanothece sp. (strain PCC 7425 / ATCC 29141) TaxID=395961 RepID=B8HVN2_CYAP4